MIDYSDFLKGLDESQAELDVLEARAKEGAWNKDYQASLCEQLRITNDRLLVIAAILKDLTEGSSE